MAPNAHSQTNRAALAAAVSIAGAVSALSAQDPGAADRLWSDQPVVFTESQAASLKYSKEHWQETVYPIGNGRLGGTVFGDPATERIQFNEDSLWVGNEHCTGGYQPFGDVYVDFGHADYSDYRRQLDIARAVQTVSYSAGGVRYRRDYFASYPAQVLVAHFSADGPGRLSGRVRLDTLHRSQFAADQLDDPSVLDALPTRAAGNTLTLAGDTDQLFWWRLHLKQPRRILGDRDYASDENITLAFEAQVRVLHVGGSLRVDGDHLVFRDCDSLTLLLAADTDYLNQRDQGWRGEHPHQRLTQQLDAAEAAGVDALLAEHIADYRTLYDRLHIDLGQTPPELLGLATAERLRRYQAEHAETGRSRDRGLEALMYQYARYLMIASSRAGHGALPANLQGIWLYHLRPPWRCDFHTDINLQMNYWFVDQANISECFRPLAEWVDSIREVRKEETRQVLGVQRGWLMRSENGVFGGSTYHFQKGDSAWISQNLWDHYAFTGDRDYLRRYAYPVMKEISEFWLDHLKELPDGTLVAPDGRSPEHGPPKSDGVTYDQQLCWDLFTNTIEASEDLGVDPDFRAQLVAARARLLGPKIGRWGQLQEWMADIDDPQDDHRHNNHLIGVHPGRQIHPSTTPDVAAAATVSVTARGNGQTGWSKIWKACIFARLLAPEKAYELLSDVILTKTYGNLWTTHPPFQIDCNFGYAAAVNEMLVQSHLDTIDLLPALPTIWADGHVTGMRLRGALQFDMRWRDGLMVQAEFRSVSDEAASHTIRYAGKTSTIQLTPGNAVTLTPDAFQ